MDDIIDIFVHKVLGILMRDSKSEEDMRVTDACLELLSSYLLNAVTQRVLMENIRIRQLGQAHISKFQILQAPNQIK